MNNSGRRRMRWTLAAAALSALLSACGGVPSIQESITKGQPLTARPPAFEPVNATSGAIYQQGMHGLLDDRRAREVGDTLVIQIVENTNASKKSSSDASRASSSSFSVPTLTGLPGKSFVGAGLSASSANKFSGSGDSAASNVFTGNIAVTVVGVEPNGNLVIGGEKQLALNQGTEVMRFTGVVNPSFISPANTVQSSQVADARIEYVGKGYLNDAQTMGWLQRFFMNVLPF